ncbi:MAG: CDP-diacylglycerol--glycerol-3-phosphate 3-phosphatidyltransferase [Clostridia bacterium]
MNLPNQLTILRILMVPLFIACFFVDRWIPWWNYLAAGIFFVADMTDVLDGYIARSRNLVTNFGKLMDPIADKVLFCSAFILLTWQGQLSPLLCIIFIVREIIVTGFRLVTAAGGTVIAANWLGKIKTALQFVGILAMLLNNPIFSQWNIRFDLIVLYAAAVFTIWSAVDYILHNKEAIKWD